MRRKASRWCTCSAGERFEERAVKLAKRSESTMVISDGLKAGEVIALADPTRQGSKKKEEKGKSGGGASPMARGDRCKS